MSLAERAAPGEPRAGSSSGVGPAWYHCITPVWGEKYVRLFLDYALPTLLTPGNLPALPARRVSYQVLTRSVDAPLLEAAPCFRRLRELARVRVEPMDDLLARPGSSAYAAMSACHERGLRQCADVDAAYLFLMPDNLWSADSLRAALAHIEQGKRAVMVAAVRTRAEGLLDDVLQQWGAPGSFPLSLASRELVELMLHHLHPVSIAQIATRAGNRSMSRYFHLVGRHGLLARCCDFLPLVVWPRVRNFSITTTVDHDFIRLACPDLEEVHVVVDSDEMHCIEVSPSVHHSLDLISTTTYTDGEVVRWMDEWTNGFHRAFLRRRVLFHARDLDDSWESALAVSDRLVGRLLEQFARAHADEADRGASWIGTRLAVPTCAAPPAESSPPRAGLRRRFHRWNQELRRRVKERLALALCPWRGEVYHRLAEGKAALLNNDYAARDRAWELRQTIAELQQEVAQLRKQIAHGAPRPEDQVRQATAAGVAATEPAIRLRRCG